MICVMKLMVCEVGWMNVLFFPLLLMKCPKNQNSSFIFSRYGERMFPFFIWKSGI